MKLVKADRSGASYDVHIELSSGQIAEYSYAAKLPLTGTGELDSNGDPVLVEVTREDYEASILRESMLLAQLQEDAIAAANDPTNPARPVPFAASGVLVADAVAVADAKRPKKTGR